jgi:autotransporter-associated beta strand protein
MPFYLGYTDPQTAPGGGTANLSGGTLDLALPGEDGNLYNGYGQSSTVNISGSACVIVPTFNMGHASVSGYSSSGIVNTLNLNGGTLNINAIVNDGSGLDTNTVNFNGGRLQATSDNVNFLSGMTHAYVKAGGALINDGGFAITIAQNLQSGASPDGGLVKSGSGTLTLNGSNTYMGGTTVSDGTLIVANVEAIADGTSLTVGNPSAFAPAPVVPSSAVAGGSGLNAAIAPVPEPGTLALWAAVLGSAAVYRSLRRRTCSSLSA